MDGPSEDWFYPSEFWLERPSPGSLSLDSCLAWLAIAILSRPLSFVAYYKSGQASPDLLGSCHCLEVHRGGSSLDRQTRIDLIGFFPF